MKKKYFLLLSILFLCFNAISQTIIKGHAPDYKGKKITLFTYANFISKNQKTLAESLIDSSGNFNFSYPIKETSLYLFKIEDIKSMLYLEPDSIYEVTFPEFDTSQIRLYSEEKWVDFIIHSPQNDLNKLIINFSALYDEFVKAHLTHFIAKRAKKPVEEFEKNVAETYQNADNPYFKTWVDASIATLKLTALMNKDKIFDQYIAHRDIPYRNDAYMDFFRQFYEGYLQDLPSASYHTIKKIVNDKMSWQDLKEILSHHQYVSSDTLLELVAINILYDNFHNKDFSKKGILIILSQIADATKIETHRNIALEVKEKLSSTIPGSYAPVWELPSLTSDDTVKLSDFKDKLVLLDFWATWCVPCIKEFPALNVLYEKYKKDIVIVSISIDKKRKKAERFAKKKHYPWYFVHFDGNYDLLESYKVKTIPLYYLIDSNGKVLLSPAPRAEELDKYLAKFFTKAKKRRKSSVLDY
ncbi:MAG: TlpA family protein disulfide reductase [Bacteroidetes bacterium]|nr:MAG: TlpA family protein disulfide reductase [Bacteroidota bacterium]